MTTARSVTRDLVVDLLKAGVPAVNHRVWRARSWPVQEWEMPALLVYAWDESKSGPEVRVAGERRYRVALSLAVELAVLDRGRDVEACEREMEDLAGEICEVILKHPALVGPEGRLDAIAGVRTTMGVDARTGEKAIGRSLIVFDVRFDEFYASPPEIECDDAAIALMPVPLAAP